MEKERHIPKITLPPRNVKAQVKVKDNGSAASSSLSTESIIEDRQPVGNNAYSENPIPSLPAQPRPSSGPAGAIRTAPTSTSATEVKKVDRRGYSVLDLQAALFRKKSRTSSHNGSLDWRDRIEMVATNLLVFGAVFLVAVFSYWGLRRLVGQNSVLTYAMGLIEYAYDKIGVTAIALIPMAVALMMLLILIVAEHLEWFRFLNDPRRYLAGIAEYSPLFGVLGTMCGLVSVMQTAVFGGGEGNSFSDAVAGMSTGIGQALVSSVVGLTVAILAGASQYAVIADWKKQEQKT